MENGCGNEGEVTVGGRGGGCLYGLMGVVYSVIIVVNIPLFSHLLKYAHCLLPFVLVVPDRIELE